MSDDDHVIHFRERDGYHPAMKPRRDVLPGRIHLTEEALEHQRLLRALASAPVTIVSKTEAIVGGQHVTLDPHTGHITCQSPVCPPEDCWHVQRLLTVAKPKKKTP